MLYDKNTKHNEFQVGKWVWQHYPPKTKEKLGKPWRGPFLIVGKPSDVTVCIQRNLTDKILTVHVHTLKAYLGDNAPKSWLGGGRGGPNSEEPMALGNPQDKGTQKVQVRQRSRLTLI